MKSIDFAARQR